MLVEMRGVEPLSENTSAGFSPSAFHGYFPLSAVHGKTAVRVASLLRISPQSFGETRSLQS